MTYVYSRYSNTETEVITLVCYYLYPITKICSTMHLDYPSVMGQAEDSLVFWLQQKETDLVKYVVRVN